MALALQVEINVLSHEALSLTTLHCDSLMLVTGKKWTFNVLKTFSIPISLYQDTEPGNQYAKNIRGEEDTQNR